MKISKILAKYHSDKVNPHTYGHIYDEIFSEFNRKDKLNILEIGIQKGGSLCAWRDYFPNAKVTGLDIVDVVLPEYRREDIDYKICDVNDFKTDETFDIVIDDGSHWLKDVIHSVALFSKKLNVKGVMVIEDVQNSHVWLPAVRTIISTDLEYNKGYTFSTAIVDGSIAGLEDNYLIIIKRES